MHFNFLALKLTVSADWKPFVMVYSYAIFDQAL